MVCALSPMFQEGYDLDTWLPSLPPRPQVPDGEVGSDGVVYVKKHVMEDLDSKWRAREQVLAERVESLAFHPDEALAALDGEKGTGNVDQVIGVRLLQRVDHLTKENDDLSKRLTESIDALAAERDQLNAQLRGVFPHLTRYIYIN